MSLQEFIKKNKELELDFRCGSCGNPLAQCGKYEIVKVGMGKGKLQKEEEGILCETCQNNGRKLVRVARIYVSPQTAVKQVSNVAIQDIDNKTIEEKEDAIEKFKKIESESIAKKEGTHVLVDNNNKKATATTEDKK